MKYKKAQYVYTTFNPNGDFLLYNVRTSKMIKICREKIEQYHCFLQQGEIGEEDILYFPWLNELVIDEFWIPVSSDETKWCKLKHNEVVYGAKELDVLLVPTNACNFRCTYCFQSHRENYMDEETERRIIKFFEKNIPKSKICRIGLFGGEPLLCAEQLLRILTEADKVCRKNGIPMVGEISTNGYLLTPELFQRFLKLRVFDFQVCIDGPKEFHNKTRPHKDNKDSFDVIMKNLRDIKNTVKSRNFSFTIRVNLTPEVELYLDGFLQELARDFQNDSCFHVAVQCVRNWGGDSITCDQIVDEEPSRYKRWYSRIRELGLQGASRLYFNPFTYCIAYRKNGYIIDYDGSILKCTHSVEDDNKVGYLDKKGNAVIDDWKVSKWYVSDTLASLDKKCEACVLYPFCMGGYCAYAKNISKNRICNYDITVSMLKEKLLDLDQQDKIRCI